MKKEQIDDLRASVLEDDMQNTQELMTPAERNIEFILEDTSIPPELKKTLWAIADKETAISNFSPEDEFRIRNKRKAIELIHICNMDPDDFDWDADLNLRQLDLKHDIKMTRSRGGFERTMEVTSTRNMNIHTNQLGQAAKGRGVVGRMLGRKPKEVEQQ